MVVCSAPLRVCAMHGLASLPTISPQLRDAGQDSSHSAHTSPQFSAPVCARTQYRYAPHTPPLCACAHHRTRALPPTCPCAPPTPPQLRPHPSTPTAPPPASPTTYNPRIRITPHLTTFTPPISPNTHFGWAGGRKRATDGGIPNAKCSVRDVTVTIDLPPRGVAGRNQRTRLPCRMVAGGAGCGGGQRADRRRGHPSAVFLPGVRDAFHSPSGAFHLPNAAVSLLLLLRQP